MTERRDRDRTTWLSERDIDRLYRPLAREVRESVKRHTMSQNMTPTMTPMAYVLILRDVDAALDQVYGRFPGDRSAPLYRVVVARCRQGRARVFGRAVEGVRARLRREPELLAAIEEGEAN